MSTALKRRNCGGQILDSAWQGDRSRCHPGLFRTVQLAVPAARRTSPSGPPEFRHVANVWRRVWVLSTAIAAGPAPLPWPQNCRRRSHRRILTCHLRVARHRTSRCPHRQVLRSLALSRRPYHATIHQIPHPVAIPQSHAAFHRRRHTTTWWAQWRDASLHPAIVA